MESRELADGWSVLKNAYKSILYNAYDSQQDRYYAECILARFMFSFLDLVLSGDESVRNGLRQLGILSGTHGGQSRPTNSSSSSGGGAVPGFMPFLRPFDSFGMGPPPMRQNRTPPNVPPPTAMSFSASSDAPLGPEELQQLFSFYSIFENGIRNHNNNNQSQATPQDGINSGDRNTTTNRSNGDAETSSSNPRE